MNGNQIIDEQLLQRLPLPLVQLCRRAQNAKTALEQHLAAYYIWEASLKLLAATAIVEYAQLKDRDPAITEKLKNLARPSVGHWWEFVRRLVPVLADRGDKGFGHVRDLVLGRVRDDMPRAAGLFAALTEALEGKTGARTTVRLTELFDRLVTYRNREIGHGATGQRPADFYRRMGETLTSGLGQILGNLDVMAGRRMIYVGEVRRLPSGGCRIDRFLLVGDAPHRLEPLELPEAAACHLPRPEYVYLEGENKPLAQVPFPSLLSLHPIVHYDADAAKAYFLNSRRGKKQAEYLCYSTGEVLVRDIGTDQRELLSQVLDQPVDVAAAEVLVEHSFAEEGANETPQPSPVGRAIGEYELLSRLGRGGMGVVYRAWQPSLGRQVALKCLLRSGDPKAEARFAREIRALGRIEHANVVKVFSSGADGDQWFYAMELIEGAELASVCDLLTGSCATDINEGHWHNALSQACADARSRETAVSKSPPAQMTANSATRQLEVVGSAPKSAARPMAQPGGRGHVRQAVAVIRQIAGAVQALHDAGVVHRDIKPGNILLTVNGAHPVLMDLGLAQLADETDGRLTQTRQFVGTLRYASPEQVLSAGQVDYRTDIYSLGVTLWELLTLRAAYDANNEMPIPDLMLRIQTTDMESPCKYNRHVPRDLSAIVMKCLDKDRERRYATARDLADDLQRFVNGDPVLAQPASLRYLAGKSLRRNKVPLAVALGVLLLMAMTWYLTRSAEDPMVELRRGEIMRRVDAKLRVKPRTDASSPHPVTVIEKSLVNNLSEFSILEDAFEVDLRDWKSISPDAPIHSTGYTTSRHMKLVKLQETDTLWIEARTSGRDLIRRAVLPNPQSAKVVAPKTHAVVGSQPMISSFLGIDVRDIPVNEEFDCHSITTYWDALQRPDERWFGVIGYPGAYKVSMLVLFPAYKPVSTFELMIAKRGDPKPRTYTGKKIVYLPPDHQWLYWEIPSPEAEHVYQVHWKWGKD